MDQLVRTSLQSLLGEILDGPRGEAGFVLNPGDPGLLASLDRLSAADASARPGGRSSIAAHVDHLRYGLELLNRWSRGDDPWADANYAASWSRQAVTDEQWRVLRDALAREARAWMAAVPQLAEPDEPALNGVLGSVVHLAYHLGAIRQIQASASGPPARD